MANLRPLMERNFLEYASYVIVDRAIPELRDGFKPVQRRILATLFAMNDGKYHKVANVIGDTMKLHPHGDASIGDALVVLANKEYFIDKQGNYGSVITGHPAAAARYIECRLTPLALDTLFNKDLTVTAPSYDGRRQEPLFLPVKLPVALLLGTEGIAVGMSTRILPHNFQELLEAQIQLLQKKQVKLLPDFPQGGLMDADEYEDGLGRVKVRARIEKRGAKQIVITEIPYGTTTESLIASIEAAAQKGRLKVGGIHDYTTDRAEIRVSLPRGVDAEETIAQLFAYTNCEISHSSSITVIADGHPRQLSVTDVLEACTKALKAQIKAELEHELGNLVDKEHWLTLEQIFIENRVYKLIETAKTRKAVRDAVWDGMHEYESQFVRPMVEDDVARLLEIRIRRISQYDIDRYRSEMEEVAAAIRAVKAKLRNLTKTTIAWLGEILDKYGSAWSRRTEISTFQEIDKKSVARQNIRVTYDEKSGFFGSAVKSGNVSFSMSAYDRVLIICQDGTYRIIGPEEKLLLPGKVLFMEPFDEKKGRYFTVVYRTKDKQAFAKKIHLLKYTRAREYRLIKDKGGRVDLLLEETPNKKGLFEDTEHGEIHVTFVPKARQRVNEGTFDLDSLEPTSPSARGTRVAPKPVSRIRRIK